MGNPNPKLMVGSLHDALKSAGVDEQLAREASEEVAELRHHPSRTEVGTTLTLILWLAAGNLVLTAIIFLHIFASG